MAFTSGSAPTILDLIDALRVFAVAQGWTNNHYGSDGSGQRLHLSKGSCFVNIRACVNETFTGNTEVFAASSGYGLWVNLSTGFTGSGTAWYKQAGANYEVSSAVNKYRYSGIMGNNTSVNYWIFAFSDVIYLIVENPSGTYHWLGFGNIQKIGDWTGGAFLFSKHQRSEVVTTKVMPFSYPMYIGLGSAEMLIYVSGFDGLTGYVSAYPVGTGNFISYRCLDDIQYKSVLWEVPPNIATGKPIILPVSAIILRDTVFSFTMPFSIVGKFQELNFINYQGLIPASDYDDGTGALYKIFPFHQKADTTAISGTPNSTTGTLGFAIKSN